MHYVLIISHDSWISRRRHSDEGKLHFRFPVLKSAQISMLIISEQGKYDLHHCAFDSALWDSVKKKKSVKFKKKKKILAGAVAGKIKHLLVKY